MIQIPREVFERFMDAVCYAALLDKVELSSTLSIYRNLRHNGSAMKL
jgi:hypothetical protein